jgi:hypothetical protein
MRRFEVICSESALSGFFKDYVCDIQDLDHDINEIQVITSWKQLLFNDSEILLDISYERWEELFLSDPMFRIFEKASQGGGSRIQLLPGIINNIAEGEIISDFPSFLCLTDKESEEMSLKYGRLFLSQPEMKSTGKLLFKENIFIVSKTANTANALKSWRGLSNDVIPLTDIIVIDSYITKNEGLENLVEILKSIIPAKQVTVPINISIITALFNDTIQSVNEKGNLFYSDVVKQLKEEFDYLVFDVSLGIFSNKSLNHDRSILTNYLWIDSGHGFNCFNKRGLPKVTTAIRYLPIFAPSGKLESSVSSFEVWMGLRKHAKRLIQKCDYKKGNFHDNLLLR